MTNPPADPGDVAAAYARRYRRHQWQTLALAAAAFAASAPGQSFLIAVFVDDFIAGTGLSRTGFSSLYAAGTIVSAAAMVLVGRIADQRGLRVTWFLAAVTLAAACGLASLATGAVLAFIALALLRTSGQGAFTLIGALLVARTFERRRGQAAAAANLGLTFASMGFPPLVAFLVLTTDWRTAYQVLALAILVLVLPAGALLWREPTRPASLPAGRRTSVPQGRPAAFRATRRGVPEVPTAIATRMLLVLAAPPLVGTAVVFHATSILEQRGIGYLAASSVVGIVGAAAGLWVVAAGSVMDRVSTKSALLLMSTVVLAATVTLLVPAQWAVYASFSLLGLGMGSVGVVNGTVWARTFGINELGRVQGMAQSSMITAAAVAPLAPALSWTLTGSYESGIVMLALTAGLAVVLAVKAVALTA